MVEANHWLFQLANVCLFLSYSARDILILRVLLLGAGVFFVLWGSIILGGSIDTIVWNGTFSLINAYRATEVAWSRRPIKFEREEHEELFAEVFGPVGIGRLEFKNLVNEGLMRKLRGGTTFLEAGNEASNLTIIYSGTMDIISAPKDGRPPEKVGKIHRMQFVESPQWANMQVQRQKVKKAAAAERRTPEEQSREGPPGISDSVDQHRAISPTVLNGEDIINGQDEELGQIATVHGEDVRAASTVEVTFRASSDVLFFTWPMEKLQDFMRKNPSVSAPLNAVIGADVASKLFTQAKAGEGEISVVQRRIYLPMDEPREPAVLSFDLTAEDDAVADELDDNTRRMAGAGSNIEVRPDGADDDTLATRSPLQAEKLWLDRRGAHDTAMDKRLGAILLSRTDLNKYEISALLSKGRWRDILQEGTVMIREGEPTTYLAMVLSGKLAVSKGEGPEARHLHTVLPGQMVGSIEFNEPEREHLAGETVKALEPCTFIAWDLDDLRELLKPRPRLRSHLTALVAADLSTKFRQIEAAV